jgi:hypothetical protein
MTLQPKKSTVYRQIWLRLRELGYDVIPLWDKSTPQRGWPTMSNTTADIANWKGRAAGVRLGGGELFCIDMDVMIAKILDMQLAGLHAFWPQFMAHCLRRHSGGTKLMLIGRCATRLKPLRTHRYTLGEAVNRVEVFGGNCTRYVAVHGQHSAGREYGYDGRSILDVPFADLPVFPEADVGAMVDMLEKVMDAAGLLKVPGGRVDGLSPRVVYDLQESQVFRLSDGDEMSIAELASWVRKVGKVEGYATLWDPASECPDRIKGNWSHEGLSLWDTHVDVSHRMADRKPVDPVDLGADLAALAPPAAPAAADKPDLKLLAGGRVELGSSRAGPWMPPRGEAGSAPAWVERYGSTGLPKPTFANARAALVAAGITCRHDTFHDWVWLSHADPARSLGKLTDKAERALRVWLLARHTLDFTAAHIHDAIASLGDENGYDPVVDMLAAAQAAWDGGARLDRVAADILHAEDTELNRACVRKTFIAAVRRARRPGCKFDHVLVLQGAEGIGKSLFWAILAGPDNFNDARVLGASAREVQEALRGVWIHENAELAGLRKSEVEATKSFVTRTHDKARAAWGRVAQEQPRQSIEVGTTNNEQYLPAQTGNRRFWPLRCTGKIDLARLQETRLQLLGEAAHYESAGETIWLDDHLEALAREAQEEARTPNHYEDALRHYLDAAPDPLAGPGDAVVTRVGGEDQITSEAVFKLLNIPTVQRGREARYVADAMRNLGWAAVRLRPEAGERVRGYWRPSKPG